MLIWTRAAKASISLEWSSQSPSGEPRAVAGFLVLRPEAGGKRHLPPERALRASLQHGAACWGLVLLLKAFALIGVDLMYLKIVAAEEWK